MLLNLVNNRSPVRREGGSEKNLDKAGNVIGKIYAFSTLGAIIGTFATGFFLISYMGTRSIVFTMGIILILAAIFSGSLFRTKKMVILFFIIAVPCLWLIFHYLYKPPLQKNTYLYRESDYFTIKLTKTTSSDGKTPLEAMILDNLIHSYVALDNPYHIEGEIHLEEPYLGTRGIKNILKRKGNTCPYSYEEDGHRGKTSSF